MTEVRKERAQSMVNSIIDTQVEALGGEVTAETVIEALRNARQDLRLLVEDIIDQCAQGVDVDGAIGDAEELTRD